jgi:hypothetical protein
LRQQQRECFVASSRDHRLMFSDPPPVEQAVDRDIGFGFIVVSEIHAPNMLVNMV